MPVSLLDPYFRMFARSVGANGGLRVQIVFHGLTGNLTGLLNVGEFAPGAYPDWSAELSSCRRCSRCRSAPRRAQVVLTSLASQRAAGRSTIVYVDPWRNI